MIQYDPAVINQFAEELYKKADNIVRKSTLQYGLMGLILLGVPAKVSGWQSGAVLPGLFGMVLAGAVGHGIGKSKAFKYRLEAQTALCQAKIEENTRKIA